MDRLRFCNPIKLCFAFLAAIIIFIDLNTRIKYKSGHIHVNTDRLIDLEDFIFLSTFAHVCDDCDNGSLIVVLIHTAIDDIFERTTIRQSWGKEKECLKFVYLIGTSTDENISKVIEFERLVFGNIVQGNFVDSYRNITYKHVMGLQWVTNYCPKAKFVVKVDDDVKVNISSLYEKLEQIKQPESLWIACRVVFKAPVLRNKDEKWTVSREEFSSDEYPDYCYGPLIIYPADVIRHLLKQSLKVPYFWVDDVFVTGILVDRLADRLGIKLINVEDRSNYNMLNFTLSHEYIESNMSHNYDIY